MRNIVFTNSDFGRQVQKRTVNRLRKFRPFPKFLSWTGSNRYLAYGSTHPPHNQDRIVMKQIVFALNIALLLILSSCNTIEGVGKDVESAGSAIKESAQKNK